MTPYLRYARISLVCILLFTSMAAYMATAPYWPGVLLASYVAIMSAWYARDRYSRHCRAMVEAEWWHRTKLGVKQPPLVPCCLRFDETAFLHDEARCTRDIQLELQTEQVQIEND